MQGKDDPLDAIRAARSALAANAMTLPRAGERQEALRVLVLARRSAVDVRRLALVQLRSVIVTAPETLRQELRHLPVGRLLRRRSRFRRSSARTPDELAIVLVLRSLARRIEAATAEADALEQEIRDHVRQFVPQLLDEAGRRPDRRRTTDRHLLTPRSPPQRSSLRTPGRRRTAARLKRPKRSATASAAAATANSTVPSTPSSSTADNTTPQHATTSPAASPKAKAHATRPASSSATSHATSTASYRTRAQQ